MPKNFSKKQIVGPKPKIIQNVVKKKKKPQLTWDKNCFRVHQVLSYKKWNKKMFEKLCQNLSYFREGPQDDMPDCSGSGRILDEDDDPNDEDYTVGIDKTQVKNGALKTQN